MFTQIQAVFQGRKEQRLVTIFGYASKGVPGLELIGLGKHCKHFKEKLIYTSKLYGVRLPLKRFVLCLEGQAVSEEEMKRGDLACLEFPLLMLLWSLGEAIPIKDLSDCLASGKVDTYGEFSFPSIMPELWLREARVKKYIGPLCASGNIPVMDYREIMSDILGRRQASGHGF